MVEKDGQAGVMLLRLLSVLGFYTDCHGLPRENSPLDVVERF